jgi:hypothetical protein
MPNWFGAANVPRARSSRSSRSPLGSSGCATRFRRAFADADPGRAAAVRGGRLRDRARSGRHARAARGRAAGISLAVRIRSAAARRLGGRTRGSVCRDCMVRLVRRPLAATHTSTLLRRTILGSSEPEAVVLLDVEPEQQKTACDFHATRSAVRRRRRRSARTLRPRQAAVSARSQRSRTARRANLQPARGRRSRAPRRRPAVRFARRTRPRLGAPPALVLDLVEGLAAAPRASGGAADAPAFRTEALPERLAEDYVLKPLFSFAGSGVNVHPTPQDCAARSAARARPLVPAREDRVRGRARSRGRRPGQGRGTGHAPAAGCSRELVAATNLCRLSRGDMHGVDHNKNMTWVGSSVGLWEDPTG